MAKYYALPRTKANARRVIGAFDICADLFSEASPNQYTDPKSIWARARSVKNMTPAQLRKFAIHAHIVLEWFYDQPSGLNKLAKL